MSTTSIEWADEVWNPVIGCERVSEGCRNCYAEKMAQRLVNMGQEVYRPTVKGTVGKPRWSGKVVSLPERLAEPLRWRKTRRVFVNSMSDLFHEDVSDEFILRVYQAMVSAPRHTFMVLTKRPARARDWFDKYGLSPDPSIPRGGTPSGEVVPPNVWLGVSVEDQATADERIPLLLDCPAAVRWVSAEPLLGPLCLEPWLGIPMWHCRTCGWQGDEAAYPIPNPGAWCPRTGCDERDLVGMPDGRTLNWVVVGGESGAKSKVRRFDANWAHDLVFRCQLAGVPVFVKQLGAAPYVGDEHGWVMVDLKLKHSKGADMAEWPEPLRVREWPEVPHV